MCRSGQALCRFNANWAGQGATATPTYTPTPTSRAAVIAQLLGFGIHIEENGQTWTDDELRGIRDGVVAVATAFNLSTTTSATLENIFQRVMISGDPPGYIVFLRLDATHNTPPPTFNNPPIFAFSTLSSQTYQVPP